MVDINSSVEEMYESFNMENSTIIGEGSFGRVHKALSNYDGQYYAIKIQKTCDFDSYVKFM